MLENSLVPFSSLNLPKVHLCWFSVTGKPSLAYKIALVKRSEIGIGLSTNDKAFSQLATAPGTIKHDNPPRVGIS